jgi:segregation and condensation protein B
MEDKEAKSILEAILFMAGEPVTLDTLRKIIGIDKYNTDRLVRELINEYSLRNPGLLIVEVAEGFQMVTNPGCAPWVKKLLSTAMPKKLSQSALETLAIVAYKQPIIKAEIEAIRGVNSDGVVKTLLERRLIKILGRKEVPGRPLMYGTTNEFLQYFGLKDLSEMPTLKEFEEVDIPELPEIAQEESEVMEPAEAEDRETFEAVDPEQDEVPSLKEQEEVKSRQDNNAI